MINIVQNELLFQDALQSKPHIRELDRADLKLSCQVKKYSFFYLWIMSFDPFDLLAYFTCQWLFFPGMSVCEWARLKVCSLVRPILRSQNPGREQDLTCRWQYGKGNISTRFLRRSYFWKNSDFQFEYTLHYSCFNSYGFLCRLLLFYKYSVVATANNWIALVLGTEGFEMLVNFRVLQWSLAPWFWLCLLWIISMILFVGVPDWKDSLSVCHALPQSVSLQVQLVQKMSSQGKYPSMITLLECKLKNSSIL